MLPAPLNETLEILWTKHLGCSLLWCNCMTFFRHPTLFTGHSGGMYALRACVCVCVCVCVWCVCASGSQRVTEVVVNQTVCPSFHFPTACEAKCVRVCISTVHMN